MDSEASKEEILCIYCKTRPRIRRWTSELEMLVKCIDCRRWCETCLRQRRTFDHPTIDCGGCATEICVWCIKAGNTNCSRCVRPICTGCRQSPKECPYCKRTTIVCLCKCKSCGQVYCADCPGDTTTAVPQLVEGYVPKNLAVQLLHPIAHYCPDCVSILCSPVVVSHIWQLKRYTEAMRAAHPDNCPPIHE